MAVREKIGRFKYVENDQIETEYEAVKEELAREISSLFGKEEF